MTAQEFLRSKRMLQEGENTFPLTGTFGQIDLIGLLDEYADQRETFIEPTAPAPKPKAVAKTKKK